jgi:flagellar hook-associated protein 1 FlgK
VSTFSGLNVAGSALNAARRALDVTGQNISNVNTEGYSRQRAELQSVGPSGVPAIWSKDSSVGNGVTADTVTRIRDAVLEGRAYTEHATSAQLTVADATYTDVQAAFREPGSDGIQQKLSDVWSAWNDVANNPNDDGARTAVLQKTQGLVDTLAASRTALDAQWDRTRDSLVALTDQVNSTAASIADLNRAIQQATGTGQNTNDLADKRDALVLQLAGQIGATAQPGRDGMVTVFVGGTALVSGTSAQSLAVSGATAPDGIADDGRPRLVTQSGGAGVAVGGTAGGQLAALGDTIPTYRDALDGIAAALYTQVNAQQAQGWDARGQEGGPLFESSSDPVTAASLSVQIKDPRELAASSLAPTVDAQGELIPAVDHGNADAMSQLRTALDSVDGKYRALVVQLGVQAASAGRALDTQTSVTQQVDADRESVSGVDLDEEMTNMLSFQHMYAAAGRLVTAIDETLDVLINHTGLVGR